MTILNLDFPESAVVPPPTDSETAWQELHDTRRTAVRWQASRFQDLASCGVGVATVPEILPVELYGGSTGIITVYGKETERWHGYFISTQWPVTAIASYSSVNLENFASKSAWLLETLSRLNEMSQLDENWDDQGSARIAPAILMAARNLVARLACDFDRTLPATFVGPISGGTLQLEWDYKDRLVEVEFLDGNQVAVLAEDKQRPPEEIRTDEFPVARIDRVKELLAWLVAQ